MKQIKLLGLDDLIKKASVYITKKEEIELIKKAYFFSEEKHKGQKRVSGEDYIQHPLNTALILTNIYADTYSLCAALLHDVIEDCDVEEKEIEKKFGKTIAILVENVSKISRLNYKLGNEYTANNYRKIIIGMSQDVRTITIKLGDRLHNMRTLWALPEEKQKRIAKETQEILVPLAHRLGIHKLKSELEDLCLKHSKSDIYYDIVEKLDVTKKERDNSIYEMIDIISKVLNDNNIKHDIKGRSKSIYSIYKKLDAGKKFTDIYDLLALRILVEDETACYTALGLIHSKYKPIPKRFKDYIAQPKPNMYQSLHTTIFGLDGFLFEIQIRTHEMNEVAEYGIASHVAYKENNAQSNVLKNAVERKISFFREILELQDNSEDSVEFLDTMKKEIFNATVYVYTPKGDVVELPKNSTPIDFAYKVHTEVGNKMIGAAVNNKLVPFDHILNTGDIIKVTTSNTSKGPNIDWLDIANTSQAKAKIKAFFAKNSKEENVETGEKELLSEIRKRKLVIKEILEDKINIFNKDHKIKKIEDLYLHIGSGKYTASEILNYITKEEEPPEVIIKTKNVKANDIKVKKDIIVEGISGIKTNVANCCEPVPGDDITGYITKSKGICIHRNHCKNIDPSEDRIINVEWNKNILKKYLSTISIHCSKTNDVLVDIVSKCKINNISIDSVKTINQSDEIIYEIKILVKNKESLNKYIEELSKTKGINSVGRLIE